MQTICHNVVRYGILLKYKTFFLGSTLKGDLLRDEQHKAGKKYPVYRKKRIALDKKVPKHQF